MHPKPLRILFVEDSEMDVALAVNTLKHHGYQPVYTRVDEAASMTAAIEGQAWDVIICDYSMPAFDGASALKLFRETGLDSPFIVFSGILGEEAAVAMMKAGAHDYVMKDNPARLGPAIERELAAAAGRRDQRRMQEAAGHLAALVESSNDAIIGESLDGRVISWNRAAVQMYGYKAGEMIGRPLSIVMLPSHQEELNETLKMIQLGEGMHRFETTRVCKDGSHVEVSVTASPIRSASGEVIGASAIERDITQQRRREAEHQRLISDLTLAVSHAKTLRGLLPICASCKKIRDDKGYWQQVEVYIEEHSQAGFTHGLCPECTKKLYPAVVANPSGVRRGEAHPGQG